MNDKREKRLNSEFKRVIYDILLNKVKSPLITEMFSVTEVITSNDLKHAKVYVSVFSSSEEKKKRTFDAIRDSEKTVRSELAKAMRIRTVPEIKFVLDGAEEYGRKIDDILSKLTYSEEKENDD